jgi:opacity protein-like surface antigen
MAKTSVAVVLAGSLCAAVATGAAEAVAATQPLSGPPAASAPSAWKQIFENSQALYYVHATDVAQPGQFDVETLLEFKIPQVVDGVQVWSVVSEMKLNCDQKQMLTVDNALHAQQMGGGRVIQLQAVNDTWHEAQPGTLGEMILSAMCGTK